MDHAIYAAHVGTPPLPAYPFSLQAAIRTLEDKIREAPQRGANYAALGDLYLFEANWLSKAIASYEIANASHVEKMLAQLKYLSEHAPADSQTRQWYRYLQVGVRLRRRLASTGTDPERPEPSPF